MGKGKGKRTMFQEDKANSSSAGGFHKDENPKDGKKDPPVKVVLSHMHDYDIIKVYVDSEFGAAKAFREAICRLRAKASEKKAIFNDIPCIGMVDAHGFPLMQLQAILEDERGQVPGKVLISKKDFYLVAFHQRSRWFQLKDIDYNIYLDEGKLCETIDFDGDYGNNRPWESIGPRSVINAINIFNRPKVKEEENEKACLAFVVHFCESSRLRLIEEIVCISFGTSGHLTFDEVEDDEVYNALKAEWHIDPTYDYGSRGVEDSISSIFSHRLNNYLSELIRDWGQISQWWIEYSLRQGTSGERREGLNELKPNLKMKYLKTIKASLGVLCRPNKDKLISGLKGKVTQKELAEIEEKLKVLGNLNQI